MCSLQSHLDKVLKVLLYAPGNAAGLSIMMQVLESLDLHNLWVLLPVSSATDLTSCGIGDMLADALERTRALLANHHTTGSIVFVGMDSPELPLDEIVNSLLNPSMAYMCPANDGGYGMLSVPPHAPSRIFESIPWSHSLTAVSQLKALTDLNVAVKLGRLMYDMDECGDVQGLAERQCSIQNGDVKVECLNNNVLMKASGDSTIPLTIGACQNTWTILQSLGLIVQVNGKFMVQTDAFV
jgi:glycosyltransferase A (GT-A) superfamily protein (DUF2064 family)